MKDGNWIALHKNLCHFLPKGRSYTLLEAMFSYTLDIDNKANYSINGYAKQWGWSRNKVRRLLVELGTVKGHIADRKGTGKGQVVLLKLNNLQDVKDRKGTGKGQERDRKRDTTIYPNPNPNPNLKKYMDFFTEFWLIAPSRNGKKIGKPEAKQKFLELKESDLPLINQAVQNYANSQDVKTRIGIKDPHRFISNKENKEYWKEWLEPDRVTSESDDYWEPFNKAQALKERNNAGQ